MAVYVQYARSHKFVLDPGTGERLRFRFAMLLSHTHLR